jgi:hypothetical protein
MKMKYNFASKMQKFLYNKTLLNVVAAISFLNIVGFVMFNQTIAIVYFILIGLITSFFSKNMNVVLLVPLILVNLFVASPLLTFLNKREGFKEGGDATDSKKTNTTTSSTNAKPNKSSNSSVSNPSSTSQGLPITPLDNGETETNASKNSESENNTDSENNVDEHFEVGRAKKNSKGYNIDYASTVEDAYDELNKILGSDGIKRLTNDTQSLMKQQLQLAESMKSMQPLIASMGPFMQQAQGLLGSMGENGNLGDLANLAKKFSAGLPNNAQ